MLISIGRRAEDGDLVALLLECHHRIRTFVALAATIGGPDPLPDAEVVEACRGCARYFAEALPLHVQDEDESLVPRMRGLDAEVDEALRVMQAQHREHQPLLAALAAALQAVQGAPSDRARRAEVGAVAAALAAAFEPHLRLEEEVLFPAVRTRLSGAACDEVLAELRARRARALG